MAAPGGLFHIRPAILRLRIFGCSRSCFRCCHRYFAIEYSLDLRIQLIQAGLHVQIRVAIERGKELSGGIERLIIVWHGRFAVGVVQVFDCPVDDV